LRPLSRPLVFELEAGVPENEFLLVVSELDEYPDFFPPVFEFPFPFPAGKLDRVVESLLSSELASFPESTEEFFFTLLGGLLKLINKLKISLIC
jgi:hypothetical protein